MKEVALVELGHSPVVNVGAAAGDLRQHDQVTV
jgi:hypothetical protein